MPPSKEGKSPRLVAVHACLRRLLRGADFEVAPAASGVSTPVYRVVTRGTVLYLRLAEGAGADLGPELYVHRLLLARGCRVPEVLVYEPWAAEVGRSVALLREIRGRPLGFDPELPPAALERVLRDAGEQLAVVNATEVEGFGWMRRDLGPERLVAAHRTLREWLRSRDEEDVERCLASLRDAGGLDIPATTPEPVERLARDPSVAAALAHGDFDLTHIFHAGGRYSGLIDFGEIRGAEPWYDLAVFFRLSQSPRSPIRERCYTWLRAGWTGGEGEDPSLSQRIRLTAWLVAVRFAGRQLDRFGPSGRDFPWVRDAISFVREAWPES